MEMKKFDLVMNSRKALIKEAVDMVVETKMECTKIWNSSEEMMEIFGLPRLENLEEAIPCMLQVEPVGADREAKDDEVLQLEEVDMKKVKRLLMEQTQHQTLIQA